MANVPDNTVMRRIEDVVKGDGEFHNAQPGAEVPPGSCNTIEQIVPQLLSKTDQLVALQLSEFAKCSRYCVQ
jgi:hypothetical protein